MNESAADSFWARQRRKTVHDWINFVSSLMPRLKSRFYYPLIFGSFGKGSLMYRPTFLGNPRYIHIGERAFIRPGVRLEVAIIDPANPPEIRIGNDVNIEQNVHIVGAGSIYLGDEVSLNANCSIMCGSHPFLDVTQGKVGARLTGLKDRVEIGKGAFLGIGCAVMSNIRIGERAVIGTASVVKRNVPPYAVVAGNPAQIILQYDKELDRWIPRQESKTTRVPD